MEAVRTGLVIGATVLVALMLVRASASVRPIWIWAAAGATLLVAVFTFVVKARLTGAILEPDLVLVATTLAITLASKAHWELLFSAEQWRNPPARPGVSAERMRNIAGVGFIVLYLVLELLFERTVLGQHVN